MGRSYAFISDDLIGAAFFTDCFLALTNFTVTFFAAISFALLDFAQRALWASAIFAFASALKTRLVDSIATVLKTGCVCLGRLGDFLAAVADNIALACSKREI